MIRVCFVLFALVSALGCDRSAPSAAKPLATEDNNVAVTPPGFDKDLLDILRCPENLTPVRLATQREVAATNERIKTGDLKTWGGNVIKDPIQAMLIRADGKIGYRFEDHAPVMIIEDALVLDEAVGRPEPDKYRK